MAYNEAQKAVAIEIVNRHGGLTREALAEIAQVLGKKVGKTTVFSWVKATSSENGTVQKNGISSEPLETLASKKLDELFESIAQKYLTEAHRSERIREMDGKALVTAAAIAVDKMRLLRDLPTEIVTVLPSFIQALQQHGINPADFVTQTIQRLNDTPVH